MKISIFCLLIFCCFVFSGCATLGMAGTGLLNVFTTLVKLPFDILSKIIDIVNKMPKPPPGVF